MKMKRILSMLLAVCMLAISVSSIFGVFSFAADDEVVEDKKTYEKATADALNPSAPYLDFNDKIAQIIFIFYIFGSR